MLDRIIIRNFKLFDEVDLELGERVVLVGPNNKGKTSALQAIALWNVGLRRWIEKRGGSQVPLKRPGVTINRRDLLAVPIPSAKLLWRDLRTHAAGDPDRRQGRTRNVYIQIIATGTHRNRTWRCGLEFYFANEESFYCRRIQEPDDGDTDALDFAAALQIAYLPPMSGLAAREVKLDSGAINVLLGEGRTAEVLRNLCYSIVQMNDGKAKWAKLTDRMKDLFGVQLEEPLYIKERGEIVMGYRTPTGIRLDLSASGRGQQQTLLLLAHMMANPGSILLLDEPDAHLEILRQRQIYQILAETAAETGSQIIAASHSEVLLNEAAERDVVIAFVGKPRRIGDRGSQVVKSLREIGFDQYYQAEIMGWVLYLEGSTDLAILRAFAERLGHRARKALERPFVFYVGNVPIKASDHFHGLREAKHDLQGIAIFDRLEKPLPSDPQLKMFMWQRNEIENYLCTRETLLAYAAETASAEHGEMFVSDWKSKMEETIRDIETSLENLGKPSPWGPDLKVSEEFLDPLFRKFYKKVGLPNRLSKTNYHVLAGCVPIDEIDDDVRQALEAIAMVADTAHPAV